jgi:hypothetical protein
MNNNKAKKYVKYYIRKCKAAATSHNRTVYASGTQGPWVSRILPKPW